MLFTQLRDIIGHVTTLRVSFIVAISWTHLTLYRAR